MKLEVERNKSHIKSRANTSYKSGLNLSAKEHADAKDDKEKYVHESMIQVRRTVNCNSFSGFFLSSHFYCYLNRIPLISEGIFINCLPNILVCSHTFSKPNKC